MSAPRSTIAEVMQAGPVIAVVTIERAGDAASIAAALADGGIRVLEVTLRTSAALQSIEAIALARPDILVGAGTARRAADFRDAGRAGARFAVSPGFTAALASAALETGLPWLPGVATASEVLLAQDSGFDRLKFYPAHSAGGIATLRGFAAVFPDLLFCPTGGITARNAAGYLELPNVACVGGSWLAPRAAMQSRDWRRIEALAAAAARLRAAR
jgi:2-dehydro-3-deoxyphosphogluconate aldolase/(4S)-4-hydroxy-2-oxoglutarate aldolase